MTRRELLILVLVGCLMFTAASAMAGDAGRESPFTSGAGARALSMGGGFTSIGDDASTVFYNPAGLTNLDYSELSFMHMTLFEGIRYNYAAWVYPTLKLGGFGVALMRVGTDDITRRVDFVETGTFDYSNFQMLLAYGNRVHPQIAFGLNMKIVNQSIDTYSDYGIGLDFSMLADFSSHTSFGIIVRDLIPAELKLNLSKESVPTSVMGGLSYRGMVFDDRVRMLASIELEKIENRSVKLHTGAELTFHNAYMLRLGYDRDNLAFGAGYRQGRFQFDYSYKLLDYIDNSHRLSVTALIGPSMAERTERVAIRDQQEGSQLLADERRRQFDFFRDKADGFYDQFRLDSAVTYYNRALAFDESNEQIIATVAAIEEAFQIQTKRREQIAHAELEIRISVENYIGQARSFYTKKNYSAALDLLKLIFNIDQNNQGALLLRSAIEDDIATDIAANLKVAGKAENEKEYFRAIEAYTRILELDPSNAEIHAAKGRLGAKLDLAHQLNLGIEMYKVGQYEEAMKRFQAVLDVDPDDPVALEYMEKLTPAADEVSTLEDLQKNKTIWQFYLDGLRFMRNKEYEKAIEAWQKVLKAYPDNLDTRNNLEQARLRLKSEESK